MSWREDQAWSKRYKSIVCYFCTWRGLGSGSKDTTFENTFSFGVDIGSQWCTNACGSHGDTQRDDSGSALVVKRDNAGTLW